MSNNTTYIEQMLTLHYGRNYINTFDIEVNKNTEYYKNGNVKAYVAVISSNRLNQSVTVRSKNVQTYKAYFNEKYDYMHRLCMIDKYNQLVRDIYFNFKSKHTNISYSTIKNFEEYKLHLMKEKKLDKKPPSKYTATEALLPLPSDKKYQKGNIFTLVSTKQSKTNRSKSKYYKDLSLYNDKLEQEKKKEINNLLNIKLHNDIVYKTEEIHNSYIEHRSNELTNKYFHEMLVFNQLNIKLFNETKTKFKVDDKNISVMFLLPNLTNIPKSCTFKTYKTKSAFKELKSDNDITDINSIISGIVLLLIVRIIQLDYKGNFDTITVNGCNNTLDTCNILLTGTVKRNYFNDLLYSDIKDPTSYLKKLDINLPI